MLINADGQLNTDASLGYNMFAYSYNNSVMLCDSSGTRPILSASTATETPEQRKLAFQSNHNYVAKEFSAQYKKSTGTDYDFQCEIYEQVTITKSVTTISTGEVIAENAIITGLGVLLSLAAPYIGISGTAATISSAVLGVGVSSTILGSGKYPTYTVTKTTFIPYPVEIANYHGYRIYEDRWFEYTVTETYIFLYDDIVSKKITHTDKSLVYRYGHH